MECYGARKQRSNLTETESAAATGKDEGNEGQELRRAGRTGAAKYLYPMAAIAIGLLILGLAAI